MLAATLLALAACSETDSGLTEHVTKIQAQAKSSNKKIVEEPSETLSPCRALYSDLSTPTDYQGTAEIDTVTGR